MLKILAGIILILFPGIACCQEGLSKPELLRMERTFLPDSTRIDVYNELAWPVYSYDDHDSSIYFAEKAIELAGKAGDLRRLAVAHRRAGITYANKGDIKEAIFHQEESYRLSEQSGNKKGMLLALNNIGVAYLNNELLNTAQTYFLRSLKLAEETGDYSSAPMLYINCGMISRRMGDHSKAKEYFRLAKYYAASQENEELMLVAYSNLSTEYRTLGELDSAEYFLVEARRYLRPEIATNNRFYYALNEALLLSSRNMHQAALESFLAMEPLATSINDKITLLINIAEEYVSLKRNAQALDYFGRAYELSRKNRMFNNLEHVTLAMADIYEAEKDYPNFSAMIRRHLAYADSNKNVNKVQQILRQQLEYDFESKRLADSIKFQQREKLKNLELEAAEGKLIKAGATRALLVAILIIVVLVSLFVFSRFVVIKRQKEIIETQKYLVEVKNEEIMDSITYAKRLQSAILPQMKNIQQQLNAGILFLPKDIIGGDFYFYEEYRRRIYFAVCDCTGHGVPGALMSVVCYEALEKAIRSFKLSDPAEILTKTREIIVENLNASEQGIRDGMDCSLLVIDKGRETVKWAGANNGLWMIKGSELTELKADKQPVAHHDTEAEFTSHELELSEGEVLYLYTDGYADQFGGPGTKKYKSKVLKEYLRSIYAEPVDRQVELLHSNFFEWKGRNDQVDDVTIAVIRF